MMKPPAQAGRRRSCRGVELGLDRVADVAQDGADLAAQEDEGDDRDDRDEGEDQRVLRETLAVLVTMERRDESDELRHGCWFLLSVEARWTMPSGPLHRDKDRPSHHRLDRADP